MEENSVVNVVRQTELPTLEPRYFERMAYSIGDKQKLLSYLPPILDKTKAPRILDVGAGGGEFSNALIELGYDVVALDASDEAIMRMRKSFPGLTTAKYLANHVDELGHASFDVVICSSLCHEIFSYGDDIHGPGHISSLERAMKAFYYVLRAGGRLLIRDGVLPANWEQEGTIEVITEDGKSAVKEYLRLCPFANGKAYGGAGRLVNLSHQAGATYHGNVRSLMEFGFTYTWGIESYPRETQELYGVMTLIEYANFIEDQGFTIAKAYSYLQEGYTANLRKKVELYVGEDFNKWPASNAIWVAVKNS